MNFENSESHDVWKFGSAAADPEPLDLPGNVPREFAQGVEEALQQESCGPPKSKGGVPGDSIRPRGHRGVQEVQS